MVLLFVDKYLVDYLGVNLRVFHVSVPKQFADGEEVCTERQEHRGESVAAGVETDVLADSGRPDPVLQVVAHVAMVRKVGEHDVLRLGILLHGQPLHRHGKGHAISTSPCPRTEVR